MSESVYVFFKKPEVESLYLIDNQDEQAQTHIRYDSIVKRLKGDINYDFAYFLQDLILLERFVNVIFKDYTFTDMVNSLDISYSAINAIRYMDFDNNMICGKEVCLTYVDVYMQYVINRLYDETMNISNNDDFLDVCSRFYKLYEGELKKYAGSSVPLFSFIFSNYGKYNRITKINFVRELKFIFFNKKYSMYFIWNKLKNFVDKYILNYNKNKKMKKSIYKNKNI